MNNFKVVIFLVVMSTLVGLSVYAEGSGAGNTMSGEESHHVAPSEAARKAPRRIGQIETDEHNAPEESELNKAIREAIEELLEKSNAPAVPVPNKVTPTGGAKIQKP